MEFIKIYTFYIKKFFQARAEYRLNFWVGILANFITYFLAYISYWIITGQLSDIAGWDFSELCVLYGMSLLTYATAGTLLWYSVYNLSGMIISGTLDVFLTRPMGILRQLICNRFGDTFLAQIFVTVLFIVIAMAGRLDGMHIWKVFYFILAVIGGTCIQAGGMIAIGAISFWTMKSEEVGEIFYYKLRNITKYPLGIFPLAVQKALTFILPWAFINYYPSALLSGKAETRFEVICGCLSPAIGIVLLIISVRFFYIGLRHYNGAGS